MRIRDFSKAFALALALVAPHTGALAQGSASHQVSISIPTVLRLRMVDSATSDRATHAVAVEVAGDVVRIEPGTTRIEIRANDDWALDVQYRPAGGSASVPLAASVDGSTWHRLSDGARIATGAPTGDWRSIDVAYRLLSAVADGSYQGTVTYSLTQP